MTIDANLVCTDDDLNSFLGGELSMNASLIPTIWNGTAKPARQYALDAVLDYLGRKSPPIYYGDLSDHTQIKRAVLFGAAEHLYSVNLTGGNQVDLFEHKRKIYAQKFEDELQGLMLNTATGERVTTGSFTVSRR